MAASVEQLKKNPILAGLNESVLRQLVETAEVYPVGQGMDYIPKTDANDEIYLIVEGQAKIDLALVGPGHPGDSFELQPGDMFCGMRFFDEQLPPQTFVANTDLVTLRWHSGDWRKICDADPEAGYHLAVGLAKQVIDRTRQVSTD